MPADDVSDLRDVVDAINRLCDTMKTSQYDDVCDDDRPPNLGAETPAASDTTDIDLYESCVDVSYDADAPAQYVEQTSESYSCNNASIPPSEIAYPEEYTVTVAKPIVLSSEGVDTSYIDCPTELVSPGDLSFRPIEVCRSERWSDSQASLPADTVTSDVVAAETASEVYYTASSEVSLLSDTEVPQHDRPVDDDDKENKGERRECVIAGHVAAMRERFESLTRTNTPCPDLMRSSSPSLDVFRNITPSPDRLG